MRWVYGLAWDSNQTSYSLTGRSSSASGSASAPGAAAFSSASAGSVARASSGFARSLGGTAIVTPMKSWRCVWYRVLLCGGTTMSYTRSCSTSHTILCIGSFSTVTAVPGVVPAEPGAASWLGGVVALWVAGLWAVG